MAELHKIEKQEKVVYFIAINEDGTYKAYGKIEPGQCMETLCYKLETYDEANKPHIFNNENELI